MKLKRYLSMEVLLFAGIMLTVSAVQAGSDERPAIHIKHRIDNATVRKMLQVLHQQCVDEKEMFVNIKKSGNPAWPIIEQDLKKNRPEYDVDADLAVIKSWEQYGVEYEEEYFYQDMYAFYKERMKYDVSQDGRCAINSIKKKSAKLDNGKYSYRVNLIKGTAVRNLSEKAIILENDKLLRSQTHEQTLVTIASKLGPAKGTLPKDADSEIVLGGEQCDYKSFANGKDTKLCYWSKMNQYPSVVSRPIILKSKIRVGNDVNVKQATVFDIKKKFDKSIFEPKPGIKITDNSGF